MTMSRSQRNLFVTLFAAIAMLLSFSAAGFVSGDTAHAATKKPTTTTTDLIGSNKISDTQMQGNTQATSLMTKMMGVAKIFAGFVLAVSVIVIVYGGLKYVLSQGDSKAAEQGKMLIIYSGIGIFISLSAFILVKMFQGFA